MNLYDILRASLGDEGSDTMWAVTKIISDTINDSLPAEKREHLMRKVYHSLNGGHFNKALADDVIQNFYYLDNDGKRMDAPYWTEAEVMRVYDRVKEDIPGYNFYDCEVTLNMVKSDNCNLLRKWFPNASRDSLDNRIIDMTVNWLNDNDNPFQDEKIWGYLMSTI